MAASSVLSVKLMPEEKAEFVDIAQDLGMYLSIAMKVMIRKFNECEGFPFDVRRTLRVKPGGWKSLSQK